MPGIFSEYCGPDLWIWRGTGIPRDTIDAICKKHDDAYERYKEKYGYYPYANFIQADQEFLNDVKVHWKDNPIVAGPAIAWFEFKARVASHFNAVDDQVQNALMKKPGLSTLPYDEFKKVVTRQGQQDTSVYKLSGNKNMPNDWDWEEITREARRYNMRGDTEPSYASQRARDQQLNRIQMGARRAGDREKRDDNERPRKTPRVREVSIGSTGDITDTEDVSISGSDINESAMEPASEARVAAFASSAAESTQGANGTGETPVDFGNPYEKGFFTETRTALLPGTAYFSFARMDKTAPCVLRIRMNSPYDVFRENTLVAQTAGTAHVKGLCNNYLTFNQDNFNPLQRFPITVEGVTPGSATVTSSGSIPSSQFIPAWRTYYERVYESYHVIETFYRITLQNEIQENNRGVTVFETDDVYTGSTASQQIPSNQPYAYYMVWPNVKTHALSGRDRNVLGSGRKIIEGVWRPGTNQMNTRNQEDIKAWYPTGAPPENPIWVEQKVLLGFVGDMQEISTRANMSIRVDLVYKVQFKDLKRPWRYPVVQQGDFQSAFNTDQLQFPVPTGVGPNPA